MFKKKDTGYINVCALCENATILKGEKDVLCKFKGVVAEDYVCRKFVYDALKRTPKAPKDLPKLDEESLL